MSATTYDTRDFVELEDRYGAHNYHPPELVITAADGVWVTDVQGKRYLDGLSAYSALNQGHRHPRILKTLIEQAQRVTLTSRAFRNDQLPLLCRDLCELTGMARALPMNTGAEAVETALKAARRWGYQHKGIPADQAEIIVCADNFHGRTITIISASTEPLYRDGFGPFTPGFIVVPYGDARALAQAITPRTCAFLFEPIQAEAGIRMPPEGYLAEAARLCRAHNVLCMVDEIQTGLGRTGRLFEHQHAGIRPDAIIVGKALSGGYYPVSALIATEEVIGVFNPGSHGSTYGGNPLGCAVARTALQVLVEEDLAGRAQRLGSAFLARLQTLRSPHVKEVRGRGLLIGIELTSPAKPFCQALMQEGLLCKEAHDNVLRFAPPLVISEQELDWAFSRLRSTLESAS